MQFDEFQCYRKQEILRNILVGLKRLSYHTSQIILHRVRETVGESKRSDSIRSGRRALLDTFKGTKGTQIFFFLAIPIFEIWPKIQNKFPQSFLFTWYEQIGVYSSTCVRSNLFFKYMSLYLRFCVDFDHKNYHTDVCFFLLQCSFRIARPLDLCDLDPAIK